MSEVLSKLLEIDLGILHAVNQLAGNWAIDHTINLLASSTLAKGMVLMAAYWYFWFDRDPGRRTETRIALINGVFSGLAAVMAARLMANLLPFRPRPIFDATSGFTIGVESLPGSFENWSSLPSDHAAFVFALSFALLPVRRSVSLAFMAYSAIVICLPRVYLGIHYPSDLLVGAMVGILVAWALPRTSLTKVSAAIVHGAQRNFAAFYAIAFLVTAELAQMFDNVRMIGRAAGKALSHVNHAHRPMVFVGLAGAIVVAAACASLVMYLRRNAGAPAAGRESVPQEAGPQGEAGKPTVAA